MAITTKYLKESNASKLFNIINIIFLTFICSLIIIPIWNVMITSFAKDKDVMGGVYLLVPKSFTFYNYVRVFNSGYIRGFWNSIITATFGTLLAMIVTVPLGYALAQRNLLFRKFFMKMVGITLVFDAGIMPFYILIRSLNLLDNRLSLIIPFAVSTFNLIIIKNYMQSIPESLSESARLDGCNDIFILIRIALPLSKPILAAVTLFYFVSFWNRYTEAVMFINNSSKYTLQVMLRALVFQSDGAMGEGATIYDNMKMTVMVLGMLPVLIIYPFVQKHFVSGLMLGGIKG